MLDRPVTRACPSDNTRCSGIVFMCYMRSALERLEPSLMRWISERASPGERALEAPPRAPVVHGSRTGSPVCADIWNIQTPLMGYKVKYGKMFKMRK